MQLQDDRTEEQRKTHTWLVVITDRFLSSWGRSKNGPSYAAWACTPGDLDQVESWVRSRTDTMRVRIVNGNYRPSGPGHCHIYVVEPGHASLEY